MAFTFYQASLPVFLRALANLAQVLRKGEQSAAERKIDPAVLINARLAPDMLPLSRQVQIASDTAKGGAARLAGLEVPNYADTETSFDDLHARIARTIDFIKSIDPAALEGAEDRAITLKFPQREFNFTGVAYLTGFVLPNLYFHITTAYDILRHNGVPLIKADFLGG